MIRKDSETPLFDGQGTERTVTNSSQTVTGTLTLDGFGNQVATTGTSSNPYMYAATSGYRNDGDAGLTHVGARYYDAEVGRFISRDTYLDQKPYLYCEHDPINNLDPSGHNPLLLLIVVIVRVIGLPGCAPAPNPQPQPGNPGPINPQPGNPPPGGVPGNGEGNGDSIGGEMGRGLQHRSDAMDAKDHNDGR